VRWIEASVLSSRSSRKGSSPARETGRNPKWERSHHDSIVPMEDTSVTLPPSTNPSRGRSGAHDLRPLCLVDRVPIRPPSAGKSVRSPQRGTG
jgi:hypothetical protein